MPRAREVETLLLTMFAAVPLYVTHAVGIVPLLAFHLVLGGIVARVLTGRTPELIPAALLRALAAGYVVFYFIDAMVISRSAIAASTHLILFIAVYQPIDSMRAHNYAQRLLITALIFIASIATSTHIAIVPFVVVFAYCMFRQLIYLSHIETVRSIGREYLESPTGRTAAFYLAGTLFIGMLLFPVLPRVRNPVVQGLTGPLTNATTGLSDSIDFTQDRTSTPDPTVVARVWMRRESVPLFTPLRLRGRLYSQYVGGEWRQERSEFREVPLRRGTYNIARPSGFTASASIQQRFTRGRLFLPTGTYAVSGLSNVFEGPTRDSYLTYQSRGNELITYSVAMARNIDPIRRPPPAARPGGHAFYPTLESGYPITPPVAALAAEVIGTETDPKKRAQLVELWMLREFEYVQRPEELEGPMTIENFLLRERKGHCEYFAAGMVVLLAAVDTPARIVGGFYGGRLNPLTGYFVVRREDAHAWVEVWDGQRWLTFDPTPGSLRPGNQQSGIVRMYATALGDSLAYFWDRYILTFGLGDQIALAAEIITRVRSIIAAGPAAVAAAMAGARSLLTVAVGAIAIVVLLAGALIWRRTRPVFQLLARELRRHGIVVGPAMTMEEALAELRITQPEIARDLEPLIALYGAERFSAEQKRERREIIRAGLARLRRV